MSDNIGITGTMVAEAAILGLVVVPGGAALIARSFGASWKSAALVGAAALGIEFVLAGVKASAAQTTPPVT